MWWLRAEQLAGPARPTRVAIVESPSRGEVSAGQTCVKVGVERAYALQHLAVRRSTHVVENRKAGSRIFDRHRDPMLGDEPAKAREYYQTRMTGAAERLRVETPAA